MDLSLTGHESLPVDQVREFATNDGRPRVAGLKPASLKGIL